MEGFASERGWEIRRVTPGAEALAADRLGNPGLVAAVESGFGQAVYSAAQARPEIRFVAVEETGVQPLPNLLVVGGDNFRRDQAAFMAGLLASIENTNDYVGWIGEAGTTRGKIYQNGFRHGIRYLCPRCRVFDFELAASADGAAGVDTASQLLTTTSTPPPRFPARREMRPSPICRRTGSASPAPDRISIPAFSPTAPPPERKAFWGRSLSGRIFCWRICCRDLWTARYFPEAVSYSLENGSLEFGPFPNAWISAARREYIQKILAEVASGRLDIGIDPQTGEER